MNEFIESLPRNQWIDATWYKPPKRRKVLGRFEDEHEAVVRWNGMYWVGQYNMRLMKTEKIVAFLIYENYREDEVME